MNKIEKLIENQNIKVDFSKISSKIDYDKIIDSSKEKKKNKWKILIPVLSSFAAASVVVAVILGVSLNSNLMAKNSAAEYDMGGAEAMPGPSQNEGEPVSGGDAAEDGPKEGQTAPSDAELEPGSADSEPGSSDSGPESADSEPGFVTFSLFVGSVAYTFNSNYLESFDKVGEFIRILTVAESSNFIDVASKQYVLYYVANDVNHSQVVATNEVYYYIGNIVA